MQMTQVQQKLNHLQNKMCQRSVIVGSYTLECLFFMFEKTVREGSAKSNHGKDVGFTVPQI